MQYKKLEELANEMLSIIKLERSRNTNIKKAEQKVVDATPTVSAPTKSNYKTILDADFKKTVPNEQFEVTNWTSGVAEDSRELLIPQFKEAVGAMVFELKDKWKNKPIERVELQGLNPNISDKWKRFQAFYEHKAEYNTKFKLQIPADGFKPDGKANGVIFQIHGEDGQGGRYDVPILSLVVQKDTWYWHISGNTTKDSNEGFMRTETDPLPLIVGKDVEFSIDMRLDPKDGFTTIYQDGKKIVDFKGTNTYEGNFVWEGDKYARGPQFGEYWWSNNKDRSEYEVDNHTIFYKSLVVNRKVK